MRIVFPPSGHPILATATRRALRVVAPLVAAAGLLAIAPQALAERADKDKPAVINADKSNGDDLNQIHVYTGDVVLTKGTIILRADQLTIKEDPEGYNFGTAIATQPNKLAYFKQKREGVDEFIEGQAERIEYDEKADTVRLFNRGIVKRLAAGRDADEIRGDRIDYNTRTEIYAANGQTCTSGSTAGCKSRVTVTLQPKIKPGSSAPDGAAARPSAPPVELRRETAIDSKSGT